jgi:hypothetical protein
MQGWASDEISDHLQLSPVEHSHLHVAPHDFPSYVVLAPPSTLQVREFPALAEHPQHILVQNEDHLEDSAPVEDDAQPWQDPLEWDTDIRKQWRDFLNQSKSSKVRQAALSVGVHEKLEYSSRLNHSHFAEEGTTY